MNPRREALLFLIAVVGLIAGGLLGVFGWQEWIIYSGGSATPHRICLEELAANGPGDNVHVKVTDFVLGARHVVAAKKGEENKGPWTRVWIPMFASGKREEAYSALGASTVGLGASPLGTGPFSATVALISGRTQAGWGSYRVVVKTYHVTNDKQLKRFYRSHDQGTLTGIIINDIHTLGPGELAELEKSYPGVDFSSALVLEEGRAFPTKQQVMLMLGGAAVLLGMAVAAAVVWVRAKRQARAAKRTSPTTK